MKSWRFEHEEAWIRFFAGLSGDELRQFAERHLVAPEDAAAFAEAARGLHEKVEAADQLNEAVGGPRDGALALAL